MLTTLKKEELEAIKKHQERKLDIITKEQIFRKEHGNNHVDEQIDESFPASDPPANY